MAQTAILPDKDLVHDLASWQKLEQAFARYDTRFGEAVLPEPLREQVLGSLSLGIGALEKCLEDLRDPDRRPHELERLGGNYASETEHLTELRTDLTSIGSEFSAVIDSQHAEAFF